MEKQVTIFSFFAGAGFLDLGFEMAGFRVAYVNEVFKPFMDAYQYARHCLNLPSPEYGYYLGNAIDFTEGNQKSVLSKLVRIARKNTNLLGFIGGSPCPDFSVGGKNKGREGDHGRLSSTYIDIVCQQNPDFFLFENVEGLWKTKKHRSFYEEIKQKLHNIGYVTTERLINAIEYGVPQDRKRIILIGFRKEILVKMGIALDGLELPPGVFPWEKYIIYPRAKVFSCPWNDKNPFQEDSILECPKNIYKELTVEHWFTNNNVNNHPNSKHYFKPRQGIARFESVEEGDDSKKSFKRLHRWRYSPTVCYGNNEVHLHPYKKRRISVAEALALQSLPKEFAFPSHLSITHMFKAIGNGVPFLAAHALASSIIDFLELER
ncbi:MAG: DNA cytosine methyltransferase [Nostoc sp. TH1S01]|nr:DNA cytosine methyltransferase [Nostoc sp. TH1S01]